MADIGSTLREARVRAQLDIADFEMRTKIRAKYLRAMEDEEWNLLPGYTFTKGFLRTYADMLGLDGRALVDEFKRQYRDPAELELAPAQPARRTDRRRRAPDRDRGETRERRVGPRPPGRPPIAAAVVVLVVLLAAALYAVGVLAGKKSPATTTPTTTSTSRRTHTHTHAPTPPAHKKLPLVGVKLVLGSSVYVCMIGYSTSSSAHPHVRIGGVTLTPSSPEPTYHDDHFHVTFGNNAVAMFVNGRKHTFPASPRASSFDILRNGIVNPLPARAAPRCT